ncbi:MAG TPA: hypothetical protein DEP65_10945 [Ruminococcus sp.]|nr:hypothetical protein [Ruminococcus sp.]
MICQEENEKNLEKIEIFLKYLLFLDVLFRQTREGMETVDEFLKTERRGPEGGTPVEEIRIKKMTVL